MSGINTDPLSRNTSKELRDALNLIGEYCCNNLPDGWQLTINLNSEKVSLDLTDPSGNDAQDWDSCDGYTLVDACDYAQQKEFGC